jgi:hypothetical protein
MCLRAFRSKMQELGHASGLSRAAQHHPGKAWEGV